MTGRDAIYLFALGGTLFVSGTGCVPMALLQESIIFPRHLTGPAVKTPQDPRIKQVFLGTDDDEQVEAWFIRGRGRSEKRPGPTIIYLHGNGELIHWCVGVVAPYARAGFNVLLPEYRGYGNCTGVPSQEAITRDMTMFYDWLADNPLVSESAIIVHGRSLGGGVAAQLAQRRPIRALILESTFYSLAEFALTFLLPEWMCRHPFRTADAVADLDIPILIIHGRRDLIVPFDHAKRLHERIPNSALVELDAEHNDMQKCCGRDYWVSIARFLRDVGVRDRGRRR